MEVIILSKKKCTKDPMLFLNKGLNFVPARKKYWFKTVIDLGTLDVALGPKENDNTSQFLVKHRKYKSNWTPKEGRKKCLDEYFRQVRDAVFRWLSRKLE